MISIEIYNVGNRIIRDFINRFTFEHVWLQILQLFMHSFVIYVLDKKKDKVQFTLLNRILRAYFSCKERIVSKTSIKVDCGSLTCIYMHICIHI